MKAPEYLAGLQGIAAFTLATNEPGLMLPLHRLLADEAPMTKEGVEATPATEGLLGISDRGLELGAAGELGIRYCGTSSAGLGRSPFIAMTLSFSWWLARLRQCRGYQIRTKKIRQNGGI